MSTKRDEEAIKYALKLLAIARTSAQISAAVNPADWVIACLLEAVDTSFTSPKAGMTSEDAEKAMVKGIKAMFRSMRETAAKEDDLDAKAKWVINDIISRVVGKRP
jgi:hypothetical protein